MTLRTDGALDRALTELAELEGVSKQEVVRRAVEDRLARTLHSAEVADASERLRARWADVLQRLGQ